MQFNNYMVWKIYIIFEGTLSRNIEKENAHFGLYFNLLISIMHIILKEDSNSNI